LGSAYAKHQYYANGWLNTTIGSFFSSTYVYNARGLLKRLTNQTGNSGPVSSEFTEMTYDAAGNRLGLTAFIPAQGKAPSASRTQTFSYDEAGQRDVLLSEISAGGGSYSENYTNRFAYDPAYNPTQIRSGALIPYNRDNQRTSTGFRHDGNGNPLDYAGGTFVSGTAFSYDAENRLSQIVSRSAEQNLSAAYGYDGLRGWRETPIQGKLFFLYDETGFSQTPLLELSASGQVIAANGFAADGWRGRYYPQGSNGYNAWYYSFDPQGNVVQRKAEGYTTWPVYDTVLYDAYGMSSGDFWTFANQGSPHKDPVGFGGQWGYFTEWETKPNTTGDVGPSLLLLTHRYYDPATGRFVNRDPIGYDGGINLYTFAGGNPVNKTDASGLRPLTQNDINTLRKLYTFLSNSEVIDLSGNAERRLTLAINEIKRAIDFVPTGTEDPASLRALFWGINQLGNTDWETTGTFSLAGFTACEPGDPTRCNYFVAGAFIDGAGANNWPGFSRLSYTKRRYEYRPVTANTLAGGGILPHLIMTYGGPEPGDIVSFRSPKDSGHTSLYLGAGLLIYHGGSGLIKVGTFGANADYGDHNGSVTRRFVP
jgi:RHS repeat-associated protein